MKTSPIFTVQSVLALAALSSAILSNDRVRLVIWMAKLAMRTGLLAGLHGLTAVSSYVHPAAEILASRDRFKVSGVYAATNSAQVIQIETVRNAVNEKFVQHSMSGSCLPFWRSTGNLGIAVIGNIAEPQPTSAVRFGQHFIHDSFEKRSVHHYILTERRTSAEG